MAETTFDELLRIRVLGKSPVGAFVAWNRWIWNKLSPGTARLPIVCYYGRFLHALVRRYSDRTQFLGTFFLRNRPQLELICRLSRRVEHASAVSLAVLGCSNGAEVYSILATLRESRPELGVTLHAVDISADVLALAQKGSYSISCPELVGESIFQRATETELQRMFDRDGDRATIKSWIREGIQWHLGDVRDAEVLNRLGPQDIVVANNFLCHMKPPQAAECLRGIARLVRPGGFLIVSGVDLDVRQHAASEQKWTPVTELLEEIHDGDVALRRDWPSSYWGLEPLDKSRKDMALRYAAAFQIGAVASENHKALEYDPSAVT